MCRAASTTCRPQGRDRLWRSRAETVIGVRPDDRQHLAASAKRGCRSKHPPGRLTTLDFGSWMSAIVLAWPKADLLLPAHSRPSRRAKRMTELGPKADGRLSVARWRKQTPRLAIPFGAETCQSTYFYQWVQGSNPCALTKFFQLIEERPRKGHVPNSRTGVRSGMPPNRTACLLTERMYHLYQMVQRFISQKRVKQRKRISR